MKLDPLKEAIKPPDYSQIIPMPDWSMRKFNEYEGKNYGSSYPPPLHRELVERFPFNPRMPAMHPALKHLLSEVIPKLFPELDPMDWKWHKEVRQRAIDRDLSERLHHRQSVEDVSAFLHEQKEIRRSTDLAAFHFDRAQERSQKQVDTNKEMRRTESLRDLATQQFLHNLRDERKIAQFAFWFLKEYAPTALLRTSIEKDLRFELSLTRVRLAQSVAVSPLELIIQTIQKKYPLIMREQLNQMFQKFALHINKVQLNNDEYAAVRAKVTAAFTHYFIDQQHRGVLNLRADQVEAHNLKLYNIFHNEKKADSLARDRQRVETFVTDLTHERHSMESMKQHLHHERWVHDQLIRDRQDLQHLFASRAQYVPIRIKDTTGFVQLDPGKFRTDYSAILDYVNAVELQQKYQAQQVDHQIHTQQQNNADYQKGIRESTLAYNDEVQRFREILRQRDFWHSADTKTALEILSTQKDVQRFLLQQLIDHQHSMKLRPRTSLHISEVGDPANSRKVS